MVRVMFNHIHVLHDKLCIMYMCVYACGCAFVLVYMCTVNNVYANSFTGRSLLLENSVRMKVECPLLMSVVIRYISCLHALYVISSFSINFMQIRTAHVIMNDSCENRTYYVNPLRYIQCYHHCCICLSTIDYFVNFQVPGT